MNCGMLALWDTFATNILHMCVSQEDGVCISVIIEYTQQKV